MNRYIITILLAVSALFAGGGEASAQVENYALSLRATGGIVSHESIEIESGSPYTIQLSVMCNEWQAKSTLLSLGSLKIQQSTKEGLLTISTPNAASHGIDVSRARVEWMQISLVANAEALNIWVNGELVDSYVGDYSWRGEGSKLNLGEGFNGSIDEVRVYSVDVAEAELSHFNTINRFHPNWAEMVLYYKCDHIGSPLEVVDYRGENSASTCNGGKIERVKNRDHKTRYMVVSGYSSFIRHNDRRFINRDMHLMTNDLIMLDAIVDGHTGQIYMQGGEDGQLDGGARYVAQLDGRKGLLSLDGKGRLSYNDNSYVELKYLRNAMNFSSWVRLERWREGATLLHKRSSDNREISISLTSPNERGVKVSINSHKLTFKGVLNPEGEWQHVAVNINPQGDHCDVSIYVNNSLKATKLIHAAIDITDMEALSYIGEGVIGALDNIIIGAVSRRDFSDYMSGESRDLRFPDGGPAASQVLGAWLFDNELRPERNSSSWQSKIEDIRAIYAPCSGFKVRVGIITHTAGADGQKVWPESIKSPEWRENLTSEVARLMPHFDGVDIDFEWLDNNPNNESWRGYGELIKSLHTVIGRDDILSASLHPVSFTLPLEAEVMDCVDYITFQNYGPRHTYLKMDRYTQFFEDAVKYGIPREKIFLSMATLIVRSDNSGVEVSGYKNLDVTGFTERTNQAIYKGTPYTFNSVDEVRRKMELLRREGSNGCMYFDMGNDLEVSHPLSLIRALNSVIASNVDELK